LDQNEINLGEATATDNGEITSITNDAPEFFSLGETTVTWTAIDSSNNFSSLTQSVSVIDTTAPEISPLEDITLEATSVDANIVNLDSPTASDIQDVTIYIIAPDVFPVGETTITWTAVDESDNSASATQTVTIVDTKKPGLSIPQDQTVEASSLEGTLVEIGQAEAHDITGISSIVHDAPDVFPLGSTLITWTATDNHDNITTAYQRITVVDTTTPTIISPQDIVAEVIDPTMNYIGLGELGAADSVSIESVTNDKPITFPFGSTTVTWTVTDTSGNISQGTQVVTLVDTTDPEIIAPSDIVAEATDLSGTMIELGEATAHDVMGIASITEHLPRFFVLGETIITWTATDTSGNSARATQTITIVDTTSPELTMPEDVMISAFSLEKQIEIGEAHAHDLAGSAFTITNDAPDTFPLGDTVVTWNVSDELGNSASSQQVISIKPCGKSLSYYNQIFGTPAADTIVGTGVADLIFAFGGDDMIFGGEGNDCIIGGDGDDIIFGNAGGDHLVGGEGNDILKGYSGDDKLTGGIGYDILDGGDDFDVSYDSASDIIIKCEEQL